MIFRLFHGVLVDFVSDSSRRWRTYVSLREQICWTDKDVFSFTALAFFDKNSRLFCKLASGSACGAFYSKYFRKLNIHFVKYDKT